MRSRKKNGAWLASSRLPAHRMSQEYFYNPLFIGRKARLAADKIVEVERGAIAMGVVRGVCALCGNDRELQDSHLLPKAVYRYVRANTDVIRSPIIVDSYSARNTDRQF